MGYIPQIDSLRGFAIMMVVLHHFSASIAAGGHFIVDIFFVISGFVLTMSLAENKKSLSAFFVGRMKRVYPALLFCLLVGSLLACLFSYQFVADQSTFTAAKATYGMSNYFLINQAVDYFASAASLNFFTHTWSISVELQFYAFLLLYCLVRNLSWVQWGILALVIASLGFYLVGEDQVYHYYSFEARFWVLGLGMLSYIWREKIPTLPRATTTIIMLVFIGFLFLPAGTQFYTRVPAAFLTCFLLIHFSRNPAGETKFTPIGRAAYSIYLWHWPLIALARNTVGLHEKSIPVVVLLIVFFSWVSYRYFERLKVFKGLVGALIVAVSAWLLFQFSGWDLYLGKPQPEFSLKQDSFWKYEKCAGNRNNVDPKAAAQNFPECFVSPVNPDSPTWYTYGDSYNLQLVPLYKQLPHNIWVYGVNGCHMLPLELVTERGEKRCYGSWLAFKAHVLGKLKANDRVVLSFSNTHFYLLEYIDGGEDPEKLSELLKEELLPFLAEIKKHGAQLTWIGSFPVLKTDPRLCYQSWSQWRTDCGKEMLDLEASQARQKMDQKIKGFIEQEGMEFLDLYTPVMEFYTEAGVFHNRNHLSSEGVMRLEEIIK